MIIAQKSSFTKASLLSPKGLIIRAVEICLFFLVLHFLGLREYTSYFFGTAYVSGSSVLGILMNLMSVLYILFYLLFVIVMPVFILASGFLYVFQRGVNGQPFFLTKARRQFVLRRILLPAFIVHLSLFATAMIRNGYVKGNKYGAVLISDYAVSSHDYWVSPIAFLGAYPYWTHYFNNRGIKAEWILRANSRDLHKVISNVKYESIVLVGHGSLNTWRAVDILVDNSHVSEMMQGLPKKHGEWLQLTCGVPDQWPVRMGELVMHEDGVYTYDGKANSYALVTDALSGFRYLKGKL